MTTIHDPVASEAARRRGAATELTKPPEEAGFPAERTGAPTEVLFPEAKRRERKRRLIVLSAIVLVLGGTAIGFVATRANSSPGTPHHAITAPPPQATNIAGLIVTPKLPEALAIGPNGDLYVVDSGRNQILRRLPSGKFQVLAGDGKRGFSGDGGPAVDAELRLGAYSGIAVARDGTVYFSDSGNDRVRAVSTNGRIETVAGGGTQALPANADEQVDARSASLVGATGLTIGPDGELYIAARFIVRLTPAGQLAWEAGANHSEPLVCSATTCTMQEQYFNNADDLAFDGDGNLVVTSNGFPLASFGIAEIRANGKLVDLGACRGEGGRPAEITVGPKGSVICAAQTGLFRIAIGAETETLIPGAGAGGQEPSALSAVLGPLPGPNPRHLNESFYGGDGVAVNRTGTVYADTSAFIGSTFNAIVELSPSGTARVVWKS